MTYKILGEECIYQDDFSADYVQYCDDGYIRNYTINEYNYQPKIVATLPQWQTSDYRIVTTKDVTNSHRANIINLLNSRLEKATTDIKKAKLQCYIISFSNKEN